MKFDLKPHVGAGNINFGSTRKEVHLILGTPQYSSEKTVINYGELSIPVPAKDGYFDNEIQITFDENNAVDFIEFSGKNAKHIEVYLNGIEVFKTPAQKLIKQITDTTNAKFNKEEEEIPYSYVYPLIDLAVWRQVIPELDETKEIISDSDEGKYFWTIAIGKKGYYKKE